MSAVRISIVALLTMCCTGFARADQRVLIIGIDGAGGRFLRDGNTPHIDSLIANGAARYDFLNEGALVAVPPAGYGASGVNWSTIVTGASAARHGVSDNSFSGSRYDQHPHFFKYLKDQDPGLFTASIVNWGPINQTILADQFADLEIQNVSDAQVRSAAVNLLQTGDPSALFLHFDQVDAAGHSQQWGSPQFYTAIAAVDALIGDVVAAMNGRPGVVAGTEDWLVMITADHGGQGFSHFASQGLVNWEVPFVVSGDSVVPGPLSQGTLRDVVPTALWHMGIDPFTAPLDGRVRGLAFGAPNGVAGDVNQDGVLSGDGSGPVASDDVAAFVAGWMSTGHQSRLEAYRHGDLNLDRTTNLGDWIILNRLNPAMARAVMASLSVPEPCTLFTSAGLGVLALSRRKRRRLSD